MCNVTANQRSTGQLSAVQSGVNCSMEEKVIVTVCDSRSTLYDSIYQYNIDPNKEPFFKKGSDVPSLIQRGEHRTRGT